MVPHNDGYFYSLQQGENIGIFGYMEKNPSQYRQNAEILKALGHPIRLCIVTGLLSGQRNVSEMVECTGIAQPTISQHINVLKAAGIIEGVREGNQILYSVVNKTAEGVVKNLE